MVTSKLASKGRTTVPKAVRDALGLSVGDEVAFHVAGNRVFLTKAGERLVDDPFALFIEWDSEADREAYADF